MTLNVFAAAMVIVVVLAILLCTVVFVALIVDTARWFARRRDLKRHRARDKKGKDEG